MDRKSLIFAVFLVLVSVLLFAIWSNTHVFAQQSPSLSSSSPPRPTAANSPSNTTISSQLKAKMCDPTNPSLKVVNTTESRPKIAIDNNIATKHRCKRIRLPPLTDYLVIELQLKMTKSFRVMSD
jgi:hypothetical protein